MDGGVQSVARGRGLAFQFDFFEIKGYAIAQFSLC